MLITIIIELQNVKTNEIKRFQIKYTQLRHCI